MGADKHGDVTALLDEIRAGRPDAPDRLVRAIHDELLKIASGKMRRERCDHTLEAGALVNEAVLRLLRGEGLTKIPNSPYLFKAAAQAMCQVLVDHDRRRKADKRQGQRNRVPLDQVLASFAKQGLDVSNVHEALQRLAQANPLQAEVVMLHFFGGMSFPKIAAYLGVSVTKVESQWRFARAWLRDELGGSER